MLKYFRADEDPKARLPKNFMQGFIEVSPTAISMNATDASLKHHTAGTRRLDSCNNLYISHPQPEAIDTRA